MKWSELAMKIKEHGNEKVREAFVEFLKARIKETEQWKNTTNDETLAFYLESLVAGYRKALMVIE